MIQRRRRDLLLGWSSAILAISVVPLAVADIVALIDSRQSHQLAGFQMAAGCKVLLDLALVGAFAFSSAAFLEESRRHRRLELGATLAAAGATVGVIGGVIATAAGIDHQIPSTYVLILTSVVAARFASVFAALGASKAFAMASRGTADALTERDRRLAWASSGLAVSYALAMISQLFLISYSSAHGASGGFTVGVSIAAAGMVLAAGAGVIGALAFYASQQRRENLVDWLPERDARLGLAMAVFVLAFFVMGLGVILQAATARELDSSTTAQIVLAGVSSLGNAVASICAAVGFASWRQRIPENPLEATGLQAQ